MNVTYAVEGLLKHIKDDLLQDFSDIIIDNFIYDEDLSFGNRVVSYVRKHPKFQKSSSSKFDNWGIIGWNRGDLETGVLNRMMKITSGPVNSSDITGESKMRMGKLNIEIKVFTNNVDIGETIEEYFHVLSGELATFEADYKDYGIMRCSIDGETSTSFEKVTLEEFGSVIGIGLNCVLNFPVVLPSKSVKRIEYIHSKIWNGYNQNNYNENLDDTWIPNSPN